MPLPLKHFYMIRHGETEANAARIMAGSTDSPLTERGKHQAECVRSLIENLEIMPRVIFHSHLSRARDTANIINARLNLPLYEDPGLTEWHAGDWEGLSYDACESMMAGWCNPPNGEDIDVFLQRVRHAKTGALEKPEQPPLIVCHGGVFRAFGKLYGLESPGVENCTLYEFQPNHAQSQFPWDVWVYRPENAPAREAAMIYSAPVGDAAAIA